MPTSDKAAATSGTIGPGGQPGGPKLEALLALAIFSIVLYLLLNKRNNIRGREIAEAEGWMNR